MKNIWQHICVGFNWSREETIVTFLLAQSDRFNPSIVAFDKDRGMEIAIVQRVVSTLRFGAVNRLALIRSMPDTETNRTLCEQVVMQCVKMPYQELTPRERQEIHHAVATVFNLPFQLRRLAAVDQNLPNVGENSLRLRLKKWIGMAR